MNDELERLVDAAASLSVTARSPESKELAARKRKEAREAINEALAKIGQLVSKLNHCDEL